MLVNVARFGFSVEVPDDLYVEALYPSETAKGDPSLDFAVGMEPGSPPDLARLSGVMLLEHAGANPWQFSAFLDARACPPLDAATFATRFQADVEGRGEQFDGLTEDVWLGSQPAFEVAWRVGLRISTARLSWSSGIRYSAQLSGFAEKRAEHDAAWRATVASFTLR